MQKKLNKYEAGTNRTSLPQRYLTLAIRKTALRRPGIIFTTVSNSLAQCWSWGAGGWPAAGGYKPTKNNLLNYQTAPMQHPEILLHKPSQFSTFAGQSARYSWMISSRKSGFIFSRYSTPKGRPCSEEKWVSTASFSRLVTSSGERRFFAARTACRYKSSWRKKTKKYGLIDQKENQVVKWMGKENNHFQNL